MKQKQLLLLLALVTLLIFPLPTLFIKPWLEDISWISILELENFKLRPIILGLGFGLGYAIISSAVLSFKLFKGIPLNIEDTVKSMDLTILEGIFISFCAGFGEEILFRSGIQTYLGIWITSFLFIAIHGYISIKTPKNSLYGLLLFPFIVGLSYKFETYGLWFAVAAHFMYDAYLFTKINRDAKR